MPSLSKLRKYKIMVDRYFEAPSVGWDQRDAANLLLEVLKNVFCQTDSIGSVVSARAVFYSYGWLVV